MTIAELMLAFAAGFKMYHTEDYDAKKMAETLLKMKAFMGFYMTGRQRFDPDEVSLETMIKDFPDVVKEHQCSDPDCMLKQHVSVLKSEYSPETAKYFAELTTILLK